MHVEQLWKIRLGDSCNVNWSDLFRIKILIILTLEHFHSN